MLKVFASGNSMVKAIGLAVGFRPWEKWPF